MVLALNTVSGQVADVSPKMLAHPHFKKFLVAVEDGQKPYLKEMYKPGTVEEKEEQRSSFLGKKKKKKAVEEEPLATEEVLEEVEEQETQPDIDIEEEN